MTKKEIYLQLLNVYQKTVKEFNIWPSVRYLPFRTQPEKIDESFDLYKNGKSLIYPYYDDDSLVKCIGKLSKSEISSEFAYAQERYKQMVMERNMKRFYGTEEGAIYKETLEKEKTDLQGQYRDLKEKSRNEVDAMVKEWLGERWGVPFFFGTNFEVALYNENGKIFGHDFTIYLEHPFTEERTFENSTISVNYGSMGSFNVVEDVDRREYLSGMSKFVNDMEKIESLRKYLFVVVTKMDSLCDAIKQKEFELKNPPLVA